MYLAHLQHLIRHHLAELRPVRLALPFRGQTQNVDFDGPQLPRHAFTTEGPARTLLLEELEVETAPNRIRGPILLKATTL